MNMFYQPAYPFYKVAYFLYKRINEKDEINFLKKYIKKGLNVVDIGANIGFYSNLMADLVGERGKVYAFEPDWRNFEHLKKTTSAKKNIILINKAVGQRNGKIKLYYSDKLNVDHQTFDIGENRTHISVPVVSLDNFFKNERIDLIKIDVQGYDYFALLGMKKTILQNKKMLLLGELWPYGLIKSGVRPEKYLKLLKQSGFKINFFKQKYYKKIHDKDKNFYCDFFAIKTN